MIIGGQKRKRGWKQSKNEKYEIPEEGNRDIERERGIIGFRGDQITPLHACQLHTTYRVAIPRVTSRKFHPLSTVYDTGSTGNIQLSISNFFIAVYRADSLSRERMSSRFFFFFFLNRCTLLFICNINTAIMNFISYQHSHQLCVLK